MLLRAELRAPLGACVPVVGGPRGASPVGVAGLWTLFEPQSDGTHAARRAAADGHVAGKEAEACVLNIIAAAALGSLKGHNVTVNKT